MCDCKKYRATAKNYMILASSKIDLNVLETEPFKQQGINQYVTTC